MDRLGAGVGGDPGFDEVGDVDGGCTGGEQLAYSLMFKEFYIFFGDDAATG